MNYLTKENRRSGAMSIAGWEAIAVLGYKLVALSFTAQVVCSDSSLSSSTRLKDLYLNAAAPFEASPDASDACIRGTEMFQKGLMDLEIWAVKMYDATGKPPSGLLRGNTNLMGDYVECLQTQSPTEVGVDPFVGQYCLANFYVEQANKDSSVKSERMRDILDSMHSYEAMKSSFEDGPSFFPSFTPVHWGLCVPSSCSESDVSRSLAERLSAFNSSLGGDLSLRVKMERGACAVKQPFSLRPGTVFTLGLLVAVGLFAIAGTIYDIRTTEKNSLQGPPRTLFGRVLLSYSLRRNARALLRTDPRPGTSQGEDITCLHGIRAFFSLTIYTIHRIVFGLFIPFTNRTYIAELLEGDWTMVFRAFWNNVDTFVVLSGLLTSYFSVKKLQEGKEINVPKMYFQRYFKFTPMFLVMVLVVGQLVEQVYSGPQVLRVINHFIENCRGFSAVVKSLFYVSNMNGINKMCYPPSHQLVTDMQMYIAAPFFVIALWRWPKRTPLVVLALIALLASYKYAVIYSWNLNSVIFNGVSLSEMETGANLMYLNPLHRLTPYLFGIGLGYFLRTSWNGSRLSRGKLLVGWCAALFAAYYSFFGTKGAARRGFVPDVSSAAMFGALQPILWSCALSWVIYVCHVGKAETLNRALSWKGFVVFSRLSYSVYMVQIPVIFYRIGTQMTPEHFSFYKLVDLNEIAVIAFFSMALTLLFLMPLVDLWKIMSENQIKSPSTTGSASKEISEAKKELGFADNHRESRSKLSFAIQEHRGSFAKKNEDDSSRNT